MLKLALTVAGLGLALSCCPDGTMRWGQFCFSSSFPHTATFRGADRACKAKDMFLVWPHTSLKTAFWEVSAKLFPRAPRGGLRFWYGASLDAKGQVFTTLQSDMRDEAGDMDWAPRPSCMTLQMYGTEEVEGPTSDAAGHLYQIRQDFAPCDELHYYWCVTKAEGFDDDDSGKNPIIP